MRKIAIIVLLLAAIIAPTALLVGQGGGAGEARINARKLEDGRIEFAMQVREGAGWSERLLPRGRYFPANAEVGRWLSSSPVDVPIASGLPIRSPWMQLSNAPFDLPAAQICAGHNCNPGKFDTDSLSSLILVSVQAKMLNWSQFR